MLVINVARGGLLHRDDAEAALQRGKIGGLGLDVAWKEPVPRDDALLKDPRVIMTPHIAGVTELSYTSMSKIVVDQCLRVRAGGVPKTFVNMCAFQCLS